MKTAKTLVAIIATTLQIGCTLEIPKDHVDKQATGADKKIVWYERPVHLANKQIVAGDLPPYGTMDYCIISEREPNDVKWTRGKLVEKTDSNYAECQTIFDNYANK